MRQIITLVLLATSGAAHPALAQPDDGHWRMHDWMDWGGGVWLGPLWMLLWLAVFMAIIVALVRWLAPIESGAHTSPRLARDILDERYARGEIDHDEYLKRREDISRSY
jgi:putative membrane protein